MIREQGEHTMSGMGTGTKIGFILISILVVIVIANLLDNKVQEGPSGAEQVTGRSTSNTTSNSIGKNKPIAAVKKETTRPVTTTSTGRLQRPVRNQKTPLTPSGNNGATAESNSGNPPIAGQPRRGTARLESVDIQRTTGVLSNDPVRKQLSPDRQPIPGKVSSVNRNEGARRNTATPPRPVAPRREFNKVVVEEGDSLWRLAERHLGSGIAYKRIIEANKGLTEDTVLSAGLVLKIPVNAEKKSTAAAAAPAVARSGRSYQIQDGDSLWRIASDQLGDGTRWKEIESANPGVNLQVLSIGKVIQLPKQ